MIRMLTERSSRFGCEVLVEAVKVKRGWFRGLGTRV